MNTVQSISKENIGFKDETLVVVTSEKIWRMTDENVNSLCVPMQLWRNMRNYLDNRAKK